MNEEKSHVGMEALVCAICGTRFETGNILLDRRMKDTLPRIAVTGFGTCDECKEKLQAGYLALVEASAPAHGRSALQPHEANRTGKIAWMKHAAFKAVFQQPLPTGKDGRVLPMVFIEPGTVDALAKMSGHDNN
jgi:hypothetical protein